MISDPKAPLSRSSMDLPEFQSPPVAPSQPAPEPLRANRHSATHVWLMRIGVLLFVFMCATIGVMLMILPWRREWAENHLLLAYPTLQTIMASGFVRGLCTGLGVLNVWIGFWEAIQYQEEG